jgi:1-deoxy-D-xylulose-5-phosphate reductoisomerase
MATATATVGNALAASPRLVSILGATGSIGSSTLDLIGRNAENYSVVALTANTDAEGLAECAIRHGAEIAVIGDPARYGILKELLSGSGVVAAAGPDALIEAAQRPADWVMAAIMGAAGLRPTFEAAAQGTHVALANKECLVSAGQVFLDAVSRSGAVLLPVDSEHSAVFQAIDASAGEDVERITLTASGGPFRSWSRAEMAKARPKDALKHPNWSMGRKITVDSATLMNKGLELIEAYYLFPVGADQLDVVIHPQSIVHCMVEYADGSVLAQMSAPDMRTPIAYALAYPERMEAPTERLNFVELKELTFEAPDHERFPALTIARDALAEGARATTLLNAANEIAVQAFLDGQIGFLSICDLVEETLASDRAAGRDEPSTLDDVLALDKIGRELASSLLPRFTLG